MTELLLPPALTDAFDGTAPASAAVGDLEGWTLGASAVRAAHTMLPVAPDLRDSGSPEVGWGLILPELPGVDFATQATAADAPAPIRRLLAHRGGKVLRYRTGQSTAAFALRDPSVPKDVPLISPPMGTGPGDLPKYLLIYGTPAQIPWEVQYNLNALRCVGRLDLVGEALERYVDAAVHDWADSVADYAAPVVWAVDHGATDMTALMRTTVAAPLAAAFGNDADMPDALFLDGRQAPAVLAGLYTALAENHPALIITTSHGLTGPPENLATRIGLPIDQDFATLDPAELLAAWQPDGAVWFAQACCSAGSNDPSVYRGLFSPTSSVGETIATAATAGRVTAPLPRALLGAEKPLRAFVGRVEPTFSWTLEFPTTADPLTVDLVDSFYRELCLGAPVGMATEPYFRPLSSILTQYTRRTNEYGSTHGAKAVAALNLALYLKVSAYDRAGLVILGDPAVSIPLPKTGQLSRPL